MKHPSRFRSTVQFLLPLLALAAFTAACRNRQNIYRCTACARADPSRCARYEGHCYGPASNSMSATSVAQAQELAAQRVCSLFFEPIPPTGPAPGCRVGISYSEAQRRESLTHFTFECTTTRQDCP